ncbi:hypothetical protein O9929_16815 [Vibrio lentus]|nr:hypothetical protein [Vibrio lentus]
MKAVPYIGVGLGVYRHSIILRRGNFRRRKSSWDISLYGKLPI